MAVLSGCQSQHDAPTSNPPADSLKASSWCGVLSPDAYRVLREQGTEPRFSGEFWLHDEDGVYVCMGCGVQLFDSGAKFKSNSGWPSFYEPAATTGVEERMDLSHGMRRMEVVCNACAGTLATSLKTALRPLDCAIASTASRWILSRGTALTLPS